MLREGRNTIICDRCGKETRFYGPAGPKRARLHALGWRTLSSMWPLQPTDYCPDCTGITDQRALTRLNKEAETLYTTV
jgi:hypothetical protein